MFTSVQGFLAALFYGTTSSCMAFLNKALLTSYGFRFPFTLLFIQMLIGLVTVEVLRLVGLVQLSPYSVSKGLKFWKPSACCAVHSVLSLLALDGMNIPMYAAIKRCTPLINLILSMQLLHKPLPSNVIVSSIALITVGCLIAGFGDLSFHAKAYAFGVLSVFIQGTYQTLIQKAAENDHSSLEIFQLNCFNCLAIFFIGSIGTFEYLDVYSYPLLNSPRFVLCLSLVTCIGAVLNYSLFLCTSWNTALTTSIVGVLKSILQTVVGFFTFGGVAYHPLNLLGLTLNTAGGILYAFGKAKDNTKDKKPLENSSHNKRNHLTKI